MARGIEVGGEDGAMCEERKDGLGLEEGEEETVVMAANQPESAITVGLRAVVWRAVEGRLEGHGKDYALELDDVPRGNT